MDEPAFLDLLNLECGVYSDERVLKFANKYGGIKEESIETVLASSRLNREIVGLIIDDKMDALIGPKHSGCIVHMNIKTKELGVEANSILDFVYLQIIQVFCLGLTIRNCEECGAYMTASRTTRKLCSDACRQKAHRAKYS